MKINDVGLPLKTKLTEDSSQPQQLNGSFGNILSEALNKVNNDLITSEKLSQDFALGKNVELHQVMLASEQANLALQLTIQIKNKIVEAYQEITRMQV